MTKRKSSTTKGAGLVDELGTAPARVHKISDGVLRTMIEAHLDELAQNVDQAYAVLEALIAAGKDGDSEDAGLARGFRPLAHGHVLALLRTTQTLVENIEHGTDRVRAYLDYGCDAHGQPVYP